MQHSSQLSWRRQHFATRRQIDCIRLPNNGPSTKYDGISIPFALYGRRQWRALTPHPASTTTASNDETGGSSVMVVGLNQYWFIYILHYCRCLMIIVMIIINYGAATHCAFIMLDILVRPSKSIFRNMVLHGLHGRILYDDRRKNDAVHCWRFIVSSNHIDCCICISFSTHKKQE